MRTLILSLLLSSSTALAPRAALAAGHGWDNGNAGDTFAAEFILTARDVVARLSLLPPSEITGIDLLKLKGALDSTDVHSEETLTLDGFEVDAINHPDKGEIIVSRSRWRALRGAEQTTQRLTLALHEYLFIIGVDDHRNVVSGKIIPLLDVKDYSPNRWWNPLNPANRIATSLEYAPNDCKIAGLDFNIANVSETVTVESTGNCGDAYRKVTVVKSSYTAPPTSDAHGTFHRFEIQVSDRKGTQLGDFTYEPEWGQCLLPQEGSCRLSGTLSTGGVDFIFWFKVQ
jgi:hypothetical protein